MLVKLMSGGANLARTNHAIHRLPLYLWEIWGAFSRSRPDVPDVAAPSGLSGSTHIREENHRGVAWRRLPGDGGIAVVVSRFAPSVTGHAHAGTLLSALLVWLDARSRGGRAILRLEDLDGQRYRPEFHTGIVEALAWLGLDWDDVFVQSDLGGQHHAALDQLASRGLLYQCRCSRARVQALGRRNDGVFVYDNRCRDKGVDNWRDQEGAVRLRLPDREVIWRDVSGAVHRREPSVATGDPVVVRRDGVVSYHLATVVDDANAGVTDIVRGRDLVASTATQVQMYELLGWPLPSYRHHPLLVERTGEKLAKLHGSQGYPVLKQRFSPGQLCAQLAGAVGLAAVASIEPKALLGSFSWERVSDRDIEVVL